MSFLHRGSVFGVNGMARTKRVGQERRAEQSKMDAARRNRPSHRL